MATPAGDEIAVRVRIDGTAAMKDADNVGRQVSSKLKGSLIGLTAMAGGAFGLFYGGIAKQAASSIASYGDLLGRGTQFGKDFAGFAGKLGAKGTAAEQTVEAFGLGGKQASRESVLSVYNMFKNIEELRQASRNNVMGAIGENEGAEAQKMFKESVEKFKAAAADFGDWQKALFQKFGFGR